MTTVVPVADKTVDLSSVRCPNLVIGIIQALRTVPPGRVLRIIATDLSAPSNVTAWARQSRNDLIEMYEENGRFIFYLRRDSAA